jgi:hypothetical protein
VLFFPNQQLLLSAPQSGTKEGFFEVYSPSGDQWKEKDRYQSPSPKDGQAFASVVSMDTCCHPDDFVRVMAVGAMNYDVTSEGNEGIIFLWLNQ